MMIQITGDFLTFQYDSHAIKYLRGSTVTVLYFLATVIFYTPSEISQDKKGAFWQGERGLSQRMLGEKCRSTESVTGLHCSPQARLYRFLTAY